MFPKLVPSLLILFTLYGSYAASSDGSVSAALSRVGLGGSDIATAAIIGSDSTTAPDTTITGGATLIEGSTDAHLVEVLTASGGQTVASINEDCALSDSFAACTVIMKNTAGSVVRSADITAVLSSPNASVPSKNGAGQVGAGVAGALVLGVVAAGVTLVGAIV